VDLVIEQIGNDVVRLADLLLKKKKKDIDKNKLNMKNTKHTRYNM